MTRIDFYLEAKDKVDVACRLVGKAFSAGHRIVVFAPDETVARQIDRLLWTTPATGFIPHCMAGDPLASETPVLIARDELPDCDEILLNLNGGQPPSFSRFQRVLEIVGPDESDKAAARDRYRFYRDRGYPIQTHDLAKRG